VYATDTGDHVVQRLRLDPETRAQLVQIADDEDAVFVPAGVLELLQDRSR
jgi:hypothetical protein